MTLSLSRSLVEARSWLQEQDEQVLRRLWDRADRVRQEKVGNAVHLRGLLEITNHCDRSCHYCGLRVANGAVPRYRMTFDEIHAGALEAVKRGYGTVVLQAGEDPGLDMDGLCQLIRRIKRETPLAVTLSLGERTADELVALRRAGGDRYLLRFETSNEELFERIHPLKEGERRGQRRAMLLRLRELGFELGSGVMVGLPGQSFDDLARDVVMFQELDLDMIGVGPYIAHPDTPLAREAALDARHHGGQTAWVETATYTMVALARLACPRANIPSTTALATVNPERGQMLGLQRGANVIMPNLTPLKYRREYQIYPNKSGSQRSPLESDSVARRQLAALGRPVATGRGDSPNMQERVTQQR